MTAQLLNTIDIFKYGYRKGYEDRAKERSYDPHSHDIPPLADTKSNALLQAVQALRDISDPVAKMERELEDGYELNGFYAIKLSEDHKYLKDIANKALKSIGELE